MDLNLVGKSALVCGSTLGIGWACATELASMGANVVLIARDENKLTKLVKELPLKDNQQHNFIVADFNNPEHVRSEVGKFCEKNSLKLIKIDGVKYNPLKDSLYLSKYKSINYITEFKKI